MFIQAEDLSAVHPDPLEHPVPVEQAVIVYRHRGGGAVTPLAVEPDQRRTDALPCGIRCEFGADCHDLECKATGSWEPAAILSQPGTSSNVKSPAVPLTSQALLQDMIRPSQLAALVAAF